jgi:putative toxin-antitoxin system antitoxin component (TIGR02293 family)
MSREKAPVQRRRPTADSEIVAPAAASETTVMESVLTAAALQSVLNRLPDRQRITLRLYYGGMTYEEIAAGQGWTVKDVKSYAQNGRRNFVRIWQELAASSVALTAETPALAHSYRPATPSLGEVAKVITRATEVIGDSDEAMRWLGTPVRALDYATPISLLGTGEGARRVEDVLGQMEHGVW